MSLQESGPMQACSVRSQLYKFPAFLRDFRIFPRQIIPKLSTMDKTCVPVIRDAHFGKWRSRQSSFFARQAGLPVVHLYGEVLSLLPLSHDYITLLPLCLMLPVGSSFPLCGPVSLRPDRKRRVGFAHMHADRRRLRTSPENNAESRVVRVYIIVFMGGEARSFRPCFR